jgi:hypothetical protein
MNTKFLAFLLSCILAASCSSAFVVTKTTTKATTTSLYNGFLDGGGNKVMNRVNEDNDMWIDEPKAKKPVGKKVPAKKPVGKKAAAKKGAPEEKAPKAAFKFPWQK